MNATRKKNNHINTKSPQTLHYKENNQPKAYHNFGKQKQTNNNTQATKTLEPNLKNTITQENKTKNTQHEQQTIRKQSKTTSSEEKKHKHSTTNKQTFQNI